MLLKRTIAAALLLAMLCATPAMASASQSRQVVAVALKQLGTPYALYSDAPNSFNCASFVTYCFNQVSSGTISKSGISGGYSRVSSVNNLKTGDVLCFKTARSEQGILNYHFGIYIGNGRFIHASTTADKVTISKLSNYKKRFLGAVRIF